MKNIPLKRSHLRLLPDARRVLAKPYLPGEETILPGQSRAHLLMARILAIPEAQVKALNTELLRRFEERHHGFRQLIARQFDSVAHYVEAPELLSAERRLLV